jgi:DNA-binding MarR family transcriptional regulator
MAERAMQETTSYLLSEVCKLRRARGSALLGEIGLHRGQPFILFALWEREGLTHSELAEQLYVRPATITNALQRMEKKGLVKRSRDTEDQRVSRVYLTEAGHQIRGEVERVWAELEEWTFAGFDPEERLLFRRLLHQIAASLVEGP